MDANNLMKKALESYQDLHLKICCMNGFAKCTDKWRIPIDEKDIQSIFKAFHEVVNPIDVLRKVEEILN